MMKKVFPNFLVLYFAFFLLASCGQEKKSEKKDLQMEASFIEVSIGGMTCTGCEQTIQASVGKLDGIKSIKASHTAANAFIEYYPSLVDSLKIKEAITESGYTVKKFIVTPQN
jgi:copper chaperone CopZ